MNPDREMKHLDENIKNDKYDTTEKFTKKG